VIFADYVYGGSFLIGSAAAVA